MASLSEIISLLTLIYSDVIEPIFCIFYAWFLIRIWRAKASDFRSPFYKFSIATGIAAISNILLYWLMKIIDVRFPFFIPDRDIFCNIDSWVSHICALAISIGKTLSFWEGKRVNIGVLAMFGLPFALYCYFPFLPARFGSTPNGNRVYLGIEEPIAKAFATCGYFFFFSSIIPMCLMSLWRLRSQRISARMSIGRYEKVLALYAVVLTTSNMFKTILQSIWFVALVLQLTALQTSVISLYLIPNTLSAFAEPVLLLVTSSKLREEIFPWLSKRKTNAKGTTIANTTSLSNRVSNMTMSAIAPSQINIRAI